MIENISEKGIRPPEETKGILKGAGNFRDLGGYGTGDGRIVKYNCVFRSNSLARLTDDDLTVLKEIDIKYVFDFRVKKEVELSPDRLPEDCDINYLNMPVVHGEFDAEVAMKRIQSGDTAWLTDEFMIEGYKKNIDEFADTWGAIVRHLADQKSLPLVFHCTAGKDRAGTCAALILLTLGVPEETVIYDYELTNIYLKEWVDMIRQTVRSDGHDPESMDPFLVANRDYIVSLIEYIKEKYGCAEEYFSTKAGIDNETLIRLKQQLLT